MIQQRNVLVSGPCVPYTSALDAALHAVAEVHIHAGGGVGFFEFRISDFGFLDIGKYGDALKIALP